MAKIDRRTAADILNIFKERSESYTPEWNMNAEDPDIAAALAVVFAGMAAGTVKKLNGVPLKNKIAFFNTANASLQPAEPSKGYVSFSLASSDSEDTYVPEGTALVSLSGEDTVRFETTDGITVSNARIEKIFCTDDAGDYIGEYENFRENGLALFSKPPANLQSHSMTIEHPFVFDIGSGSRIRLRFFRRGGIPVPESVVSKLADENEVRIEYYAGEEIGYVPFGKAEIDNGGLLLLKRDKNSPGLMTNSSGNYELGFTVKDIAAFDKFSFVKITAASSGSDIECDFASDGDIEFPRSEFFPFGERFRLFGEAYFGCREALGKRGAEITMSFDVKFLMIPLENSQETQTEWKWVAKKSELKEPVEYDISILETVWEYYNGSGWCRLFPDNPYGEIFTAANGITEGRRSIRFICPNDIAPVFVGAREDLFIRARITKAENLYKTVGNFVSPCVRNLSFEYSYLNTGVSVGEITVQNNLAVSKFDPAADADGFTPFVKTGSPGRAVYLGFSEPPQNGPYRILWDISENPLAKPFRFEWEYLTEDGFKPLNLIDETAGFTKTGLTIFPDNRGFQKRSLFASELYWVRIIKPDNEKNGFYAPNIAAVSENSVKAVNKDRRAEELFAMNVYCGNAEFALSEKNILELELYVNETAYISEPEEAALENENRIIRQPGGEIWVKWLETAAFTSENIDSRCYTLDRGLGRFTFGDGRFGKIPPASDTNNIRVVYTSGGGSRSNAETGQINRIERSAGLVTGVTNYKRFIGGCDAETVEDAMDRCAADLRTQGKVITARDYERLVLHASRNIARVCCFSGYDCFGKKEGGAVTLVIVKNEGSDFGEIRRKITDFLNQRTSCAVTSAGKLYVIEPEYTEMNIRAVINLKGKNKNAGDFFLVKTNIENNLKSFLDPAGEAGLRREIGQIPSEQQIRSCILGAEKTAQIDSIFITLRVRSAEIDAEEAAKHRFIFPKNGKHDIIINAV